MARNAFVCPRPPRCSGARLGHRRVALAVRCSHDRRLVVEGGGIRSLPPPLRSVSAYRPFLRRAVRLRWLPFPESSPHIGHGRRRAPHPTARWDGEANARQFGASAVCQGPPHHDSCPVGPGLRRDADHLDRIGSSPSLTRGFPRSARFLQWDAGIRLHFVRGRVSAGVHENRRPAASPPRPVARSAPKSGGRQ